MLTFFAPSYYEKRNWKYKKILIANLGGDQYFYSSILFLSILSAELITRSRSHSGLRTVTSASKVKRILFANAKLTDCSQKLNDFLPDKPKSKF